MSPVSVKVNAALVNPLPPKIPLPVPVSVNVIGAAVPTAASRKAQITPRHEKLHKYPMKTNSPCLLGSCLNPKDNRRAAPKDIAVWRLNTEIGV